MARPGRTGSPLHIALIAALGLVPAARAGATSYVAPPSPREMLCDVDGDGTQELLMRREPAHDLVRIQQIGPSGVVRTAHLPTGNGAFELAGCGDPNGDGRDELLFDGVPYSRLTALGSDLAPVCHTYVGTGDGAYPIAAVGDLDGNGFSDVLRGVAGGAWLRVDFFADPQPQCFEHDRTRWLSPGGGAYELVALGDANGDGKDDAVVERPGEVRIDLSADAFGRFYLAIDPAERVFALRDTSGDAKADLLSNTPSGTIVRLLNGGEVLATGFVPNGDGAYPTRLVADVNGDGKADLIGGVEGGAFVRVTLLDGIRVLPQIYVSTGAGAFALRQVGDFDANGTNDLVLEGAGWTRLALFDWYPAAATRSVFVRSDGWSPIDSRAPLP